MVMYRKKPLSFPLENPGTVKNKLNHNMLKASDQQTNDQNWVLTLKYMKDLPKFFLSLTFFLESIHKDAS